MLTDIRQSPHYAKYMENIGWMVDRKNGVNYYIKKFPLIGSFIKIQRPEKIVYQHIDVLAVKHKAFQIIIEPKKSTHYSQLIAHNFRSSKSPYLPSKTVHIDLTKSEKLLLKEMHHKTRYNIKKSHNSLLTTHNSKGIQSFANFWQDCARKQRNMYLSQIKDIIEIYRAFGKNADIISVLHSNELVAGIFLLHSDNISYYMYAAASDSGKRLFAPTLAAWEAIRTAKKRGSELFDFEGIYDERFPLKSWKGFTRFKKSFGGDEIEYPGAFTKFRIPL